MKQGSGKGISAGQKRESVVHAISPRGATQLGAMEFKNPSPLNAGRGFTAPAPVGKTIHPSGSQGRRK